MRGAAPPEGAQYTLISLRTGERETEGREAQYTLISPQIESRVTESGATESRATEDRADNRLNFNHFIRLYRVFGPHVRKQWWTLLVAMIGMLGSITTTLLQPWPLALILDHIILETPFPEEARFITTWAGNDTNTLLLLLSGSFAVIMFADALLSYIHRYYLAVAKGRIMTDIRRRIFSHLQNLSMSFHDSAQSGDVAYRLTSDIKETKIVLVDGPAAIINRVLKFGSAAVALTMIDWRLGAVAFTVIPFLYIYSVRFGKGVKHATKTEKKKASKVASIVSENITAMALVQAYGREDVEQAHFAQENAASVKARVSALRLSEIFKRFANILVAIGTALVVFVGGWLMLTGLLLPGALVVAVSYLKPLYSPIDKLAVLFVQMVQAQVSGDRLLEFVEHEAATADSRDTIEPLIVGGQVEFDHVTFGYRADTDVLKDLSFSVKPGQTVALVGHSGAGKSTLMGLLLRFYDPRQGQIRLDGHDIRKFSQRSLRSHMTLVFQEALLLRKSIRDNIAMGNPHATLTEIEEAARLAQIHDFITTLPNGYDTLVEEGGENFSGGQRQRISIARAILRNTPLLLLDEPSTALDAHAARQVQQALKTLRQNRTTFVIAHNFETIVDADTILVIDEGELLQQGTHQELMESSPQYRAFYEQQFPQQLADSQPSVSDNLSVSQQTANHQQLSHRQPIAVSNSSE